MTGTVCQDTYNPLVHQPVFQDCDATNASCGGLFTADTRIILTNAQRVGLTAGEKFSGLAVYESDTSREMLWDGTGWVIMSEPEQTYTPALTNVNIGANGFITGKYQRHDGRCTWHVNVGLDGSGLAVTGLIGVALPVAAIRYGQAPPTSYIQDTGVGTNLGMAVMGTLSRVDLYATLANQTYAQTAPTSATVPMTWAATDQFYMGGEYVMTTRYS